MKQHLKALTIVVMIAALLIWAFLHFMGPKLTEAPNTYASLEVMEKEGVQSFSYKNLNGQSFELRDLYGKIVILNFWASWCTPCVEEVPSLIKLAKEFKGDVRLIAVSGDSNREDVESFMKSFPELRDVSIQIVHDEDRSLMSRFQVVRLPESLILGKDQRLAKKLVGSIEWYNKDSIEYMKALLAK